MNEINCDQTTRAKNYFDFKYRTCFQTKILISSLGLEILTSSPVLEIFQVCLVLKPCFSLPHNKVDQYILEGNLSLLL